jgi:hypothetical protein
MNWKELVNGLLLKEAESAGFEILLTGDTNINYQQNITGRSISVVALRAYNNRRKTHDAVYQWNPQTMQEIMTSGAEPYHTVILAVLIMAIAGLSLWASPFLAYKVASGQIYESVSSIISGWMGAIVGAGVEFYSASAAAQINRQAEQMQALGVFGGEMMRAESGRVIKIAEVGGYIIDMSEKRHDEVIEYMIR